jgi:hypothetical protein
MGKDRALKRLPACKGRKVAEVKTFGHVRNPCVSQPEPLRMSIILA